MVFAVLPLLEGLLRISEGVLLSEELSCIIAHFTPSFVPAPTPPTPLLAPLLVLLVPFELLVVLLVFPDFDRGDGCDEGSIEGFEKGLEVGDDVGIEVGDDVGIVLGDDVGILVGDDVRIEVVDDVGIELGDDVGIVVGDDVGIEVGGGQSSPISVQTVSLIQPSLSLTRAKTAGRFVSAQTNFGIEKYK